MERFEFIGVGAGPSNLSLAALAEPVTDLSAAFLEVKPRFQWHPGIMLPGAELQVSFMKDLVTLVDPTSRYSFLNFLVDKGRVYRSLMANGTAVSRREFEQYYQWAAEQLPSIRFERRVKSVVLGDGGLEVSCEGGERLLARSLVLGTGKEPVLPDFAASLRGPEVLHGSELLTVRPQVAGRRVMVVGAGQSGAEIVNHLLSDDRRLPSELTWVSSREGFLPIDDSPFTNEWFAPPYVDHFQGLSEDRRRTLLGRQRLASDGVSESLLRSVYRKLYLLDMTGDGRLRHHLVPCRRVVDVRRRSGALDITLRDEDRDTTQSCAVDVVVFCTGYRSGFPDFMEPLRDRLTDSDGELRVRPDYSLEWDGPADLRIYVQNFAEHTHGIADPNLSLTAWRSARVLNSIAGREIYRIDHALTTVDWAWEPRTLTHDPAPTAPTTTLAEQR
ncbi:lysine N(6)-hydroxylase/L-ornithine N(5)-oxygenase family protein [Streptomyces paradoxus]|uniref:lysine N(6)-hydroxylase/L-ornithine N(5)-oxygenase family protein n=1 Tax=Streptomyces paradoxus TaxID=66375 RepID=UPI0038258DC6